MATHHSHNGYKKHNLSFHHSTNPSNILSILSPLILPLHSFVGPWSTIWAWPNYTVLPLWREMSSFLILEVIELVILGIILSIFYYYFYLILHSFYIYGVGPSIDAPAYLKFTFGEVPSDVAEPFLPYTGTIPLLFMIFNT